MAADSPVRALALDCRVPVGQDWSPNTWSPIGVPVDDFDQALAANHEAIKRALPIAEQELATLTSRRLELQEKIRKARLILGLPAEAIAPAKQASLREAMIAVLMQHPDGLSAPAIAEEIERLDLYRRGDGRPPGYSQVHNRVTHHPDQFVRFEGRIRLSQPGDA